MKIIIYLIYHNYQIHCKILQCSHNNLSSLPQLPNSLEILYCGRNNLSSLPQLPYSLTCLNCSNNNLSSLPQLPKSLKKLWCWNNNLSSLPQLPNSLKKLDCDNNPIYDYIERYFHGDWKQYREFQHKIHNITMKVFANKIGSWYLECKYNPKYKYCKDRINKEYENLY